MQASRAIVSCSIYRYCLRICAHEVLTTMLMSVTTRCRCKAQSIYSHRKAPMGSMCAALRAGIIPAANVTRSSTGMAVPNVKASCGLTPYSCACKARPKNHVAGRPV